MVVIGGGEVAERKTESLLDTGASVTVISPHVTQRLTSLANTKRIELHTREYVRGDCKDAALVLSATDEPEVSRAVWEEAKAAEILVNTADTPALCDFIMPAIIRRGDLTIAISTGGASPALASRLKEELSRFLGPEYELFLELLAQVRPEIQRRIQDERARKALHYRILDSRVLTLLQQKDSDGAARLLRELIEDFTCQERTS